MIRFVKEKDREALTALWDACFPNDEKFRAEFFARRFVPGCALVALDGDRVTAAIYTVPVTAERDGVQTAARYIVGAGTSPEYRRRGLMTALLDAARGAFPGVPLFLYPCNGQMCRYYEGRWFFRSRTAKTYDISALEFPTRLREIAFDSAKADEIYKGQNQLYGALLRDETAYALSDAAVAVNGGYAFVRGNAASEALACDRESAVTLLSVLAAHGVRTVTTVARSEVDKFLLSVGAEAEVAPTGLCSNPAYAGMYIPEIY